MKLITSVQGVAAVRALSEDVYPAASSPPIQNIVAGVRALFNFVISPPAESLVTGLPLVFQTGRTTKDEHEFGIQHLIMLQDGDMVACANTDLAEYGLNTFIKYLDAEFGYSMEMKSDVRYYSSTVIVEFENEIGNLIPSFKKIQRIIDGEAKEQDNSFELLRLAFSKGISRMPAPAGASPLDGVQRTDFVIERRSSHPFSANRFFCIAPMRTSEHIDALEKIEKLLL